MAEFAEMIGRPCDSWQRWLFIHGLELLPDGRPRFRQLLVLVARQNGKALDVDTPVLTSAGWSTMGRLRSGDEVFHPGGYPVRVVGAFAPMHGRDCFRVSTTDGRSVVADADHLWTVTDKRSYVPRSDGGVARAFRTRTVTTRQMLDEGLSRYVSGGRYSTADGKRYATNEYRFVLPTQEPIKSPDVVLPVDPYLFGAWLGDGCSRGAALTVGAGDLDHMVAEVCRVGRVVSLTPDPRSGAYRLGFRLHAPHGDGWQSRMTRLGVLRAKAVPDVFLTAGTSQREALLQGLLDTDGSISRAGQVEFCSTARALADAVLYLARSLGWRATLVEGRATLGGRDCGAKYRVCFTPTRGDSFRPFRMARKLARVKPVDGGRGRTTVSVASIVPVASRPVRCIRVDAPDGLFLAGRDLVATHNTESLVLLSLFWLFIQRVPLILGTSTKLDYAQESWEKAIKLAVADPELAEMIPAKGGIRRTNGEQTLSTVDGCRYKIAASNEEGGRSLTVHRLVEDELRQHRSWDAHEAAENAMNAVADGQAWAISNAGDDRSVVLNSLQESAEGFIESGRGDYRLGLFEWSSLPGSDPTDLEALAQANPNLGRRIDVEALLGKAQRAKDAGGEQLTKFLTEVMCLRVKSMAGLPIPLDAWNGCADSGSTIVGDDVAVAFAIGPGLHSASVGVAGFRADGVPHVEVVEHGSGTEWLPGCLAGIVERLGLRRVYAPATAFVESVLPDVRDTGVEVELLPSRGLAAGYQTLSSEVEGNRIRHLGDPLLFDALVGAIKRDVGDGAWVLSHRSSDVDISPLEAVTAARRGLAELGDPVGPLVMRL